MHSSNHSAKSSSSGGSLSGFPEEDLRSGGRNNNGYFPARLGQALERGRYCIVRKLGWGQYSSVWLARDKDNERFVSLKILTCQATKALAGGQLSDELGLLKKIAFSESSHRGFRHNLAYHDSFIFTGPHGEHRCIVTDVLGFSLNYVRKLRPDRVVQPSTVKRVIKQVLFGLEYLHEVCNIVHADIKHDNILFRLGDVTDIVAHELVNQPSVTYDCGTAVCPPVIPIVSQPLPPTLDLVIREAQLEAVIADVGHSHWRDHHFQELVQPKALRAPEVILGYKWDTPADIWNLGCLVVELLIGFWLFEPYSQGGWDFEEDHLALMTEVLGTTFDPNFLKKCQHRQKYFKDDGTFAHFTEHTAPTWPIGKLLDTYSLIEGEAELDAAETFIRRCLKLVPEERATAKELIDDPWLKNTNISVDGHNNLSGNAVGTDEDGT